MTENRSFLSTQHPSIQFVALILFAIVTTSVMALLATLLAIPMFGINVFVGDGVMANLSNPSVVYAMKLLQFFNAIGLFIFPPILYAIFMGERPIRFFQLDKSASIVKIALVPLLIVVSLPLINFLAEINASVKLPEFMRGFELWMKSSEENAAKLTEVFLQYNSVLELFFNVIIIALIPAVGEELLFRGAIQRIFGDWTKNAHLAIWISAILFSALHGQFYGFLPRMLLGAMFGYLYLWTGSLWLPILGHFTNNFGALVIHVLIGKGVIPKEAEKFGAEGEMVIPVVISVLMVGYLLYYFKGSIINAEDSSRLRSN